MYELDKEKCGAFLAGLRKEKGLTQKELAERLFVSDKAVSKWERGQSMPDVALLPPLAEALGVTVTELLQGERMESSQLAVEQVEELVSGAIGLKEDTHQGRTKRFWRRLWIACAAAVGMEVMFAAQSLSGVELLDGLALVEILTLIFGFYFCWCAKERIPAFYDQNKINFYSDGPFRMNLPGVHFNNSNWPHILRAGRLWMLGAAVLYPLVYLAARNLFAGAARNILLPLQLIACLGFFVPTIIAGKRYE